MGQELFNEDVVVDGLVQGITLKGTGLTPGYVLYAGTGGVVKGEAAFAYNETTNTLTVDNITLAGGISNTTITDTRSSGLSFVTSTRRLISNSQTGYFYHTDAHSGVGNVIGERYQRTATGISSGAVDTDTARLEFDFVEGDSATTATHNGQAKMWLTSHAGEFLALTAALNGSTATITVPNLVVSTGAALASPVITGTASVPTATAGDNTTKPASTAYVIGAIATAVAGLLELQGNLDASASPNYPAANKGDTYYISVAGKVGGASGKSVNVGDAVIAKLDNAGGTEASVGTSWFVLDNPAGDLQAANNLSELTNMTTALTNLGGVAPTGTGAIVRATGATLATPNLGTPTAIVLTNGTGLPITGLTTFTSAQLKTLVSDETGTGGALVFADSPALTGTPTTPTPANGATTQIANATFANSVRRYNAVTWFGMDPTGTTDCTAALLSALGTLHAAGGGTLYFPAGIYRINGYILFPWTVIVSVGEISTIIIEGDGMSAQSENTTPARGTFFKFYGTTSAGSGEQAHFDIRGLGTVVIRDVGFFNAGTVSTPFVYYTMTQPIIQRCSFNGRTGLSGTSCNQDAIVLGGTGTTVGTGSTGPFQGYGAVIEGCFFHRIRAWVKMQNWANGVVCRENYGSTLCGGGTTDAPFMIDPGSAGGAFAYGNVIGPGNIIELSNYRQAVYQNNVVVGTRFFNNWIGDVSTYSPCYYAKATNGQSINFTDNFNDGGVSVIDDVAAAGSYGVLGGVSQRLFDAHFVGSFPVYVDSTLGTNGGIRFTETGTNNHWRIGLGATDFWQLYCEKNGDSARTALGYQHVPGGGYSFMYFYPHTSAGDVYVQNQSGATWYLSPDGKDTHFGNAGQDALYYSDSTNKLIAVVPLVVGTAGPNTSQLHTMPAVTSDTFALLNASQVLANKEVKTTVRTAVTLTDGATVNTDASLGTIFRLTIAGTGRTMANPTNPVDGQTIIYEIKQDGTGNRTITTWGTAFSWGTPGAPTLSIGANKMDVFAFNYRSSESKWVALGPGSFNHL